MGIEEERGRRREKSRTGQVVDSRQHGVYGWVGEQTDWVDIEGQ
jgi:hypothetical protein